MATNTKKVNEVSEFANLGYAHLYNTTPRDSREIHLLDSTLREGEQAPGITFSHRQRLQIAWMLDYFGVDAIEISPIVSADHQRSTKEIIKAGLEADIVAHIRALKSDIDEALKCDAEWVAMYHSASDIHLKYKLKVSREEAVRRSVEAVEYAKSHGLKMRFTLEDASRAEPEFLKRFAKAVAEAGATRIGLPDTVGALRPQGMFKLVRMVREVVHNPIDLHCHNDLGLALANSLAGVEAGADQIHVTVNGLGERVGITPLAEAAVALKIFYGANLDVRLNMLTELSQLVESYTGVKTHPMTPLVGVNAYKHKAGTHVAAVLRARSAYELIPPKVVGNRRRIIIGELSGKSEAAFLLKLLGLEPDEKDALNAARGLKNLMCGDLFEVELTDEMERLILELDEAVNKVKP
ncbi:MAG: 2-isopropylmalate synthase [Nitrososphaerales archaeon]